MIGEIRQNFTEASASVGLILATALKREPNNAGLVSGSQIKGVTSCLVSNLARVFQYVIVLMLKNGFGNGLVEYICRITGI